MLGLFLALREGLHLIDSFLALEIVYESLDGQLKSVEGAGLYITHEILVGDELSIVGERVVLGEKALIQNAVPVIVLIVLLYALSIQHVCRSGSRCVTLGGLKLLEEEHLLVLCRVFDDVFPQLKELVLVEGKESQVFGDLTCPIREIGLRQLWNGQRSLPNGRGQQG